MTQATKKETDMCICGHPREQHILVYTPVLTALCNERGTCKCVGFWDIKL